MTQVSQESEQSNAERNDISDIVTSEIGHTTGKLLQNEESGEKRVEFFITLVAAVIAALAAAWLNAINKTSDSVSATASVSEVTEAKASGAAITAEPALKGEYDALAVASLASLLIVLGFGILTLFRVVKRNQVTEEYKQVSSYLRKRTCLDDPFDVVGKVEENCKLKIRGFGLTYSVAYLNSIILVIIFVLTWRLGLMPVNGGVQAASLGVSIFLATAWVQVWFSRKRRGEYKQALKKAFEAQFRKDSPYRNHASDE